VAQSVDYTGRAVDELRSAAYYQEIARDCDRCDPRRPVFISLGLRLRGLRLRASGESAALLQGTHYCRRGFSLPHRSPRDCSCVLTPRWTPRCARRPLQAQARKKCCCVVVTLLIVVGVVVLTLYFRYVAPDLMAAMEMAMARAETRNSKDSVQASKAQHYTSVIM